MNGWASDVVPRRMASKIWGGLEWAALAFLLGAATMATVLAH